MDWTSEAFAVQLPEFLNLGTGFNKYFTAVPALTEELKEAAYRIRHEVYCRELGFEPLRENGIETDACDAHSEHCLLRSISTGEYVGCIRLVFANPEEPLSPFPFEKICAATLDQSIVDSLRNRRHRIAEISRLAVISRFRRRKGETRAPIGLSDSDFGSPEHPRFPYIPVGLYLGMLTLARRHSIETLFVLTEPRLAKHLSRLGVKIQQIGGPVEHRGTRIPSMMQVDSIIEGLNFLVRPLYNVILNEINSAYDRRKL